MNPEHDNLNRARNSSVQAPRVFVIGYQSFADCLEWHVMDALNHMGIPAQFFQTHFYTGISYDLDRAINKLAASVMREPERLSEKKLLAALSEFQPEFVLVIQGTRLSPKTVERMRAVTKAPIACWYQDAVSSIGRQFMLGAEYDAVFVKDRYMQSIFSRMIRSATFFYLPEACNPRVHRSVQLTPEDQEKYGCDMMIAGTHYYYRQEILRQLSGIKLRFYSGTRPQWLLDRLPQEVLTGKPVVLEEKAKATKAARICLNTLHFAEINGLNCRAFEIAGCGGFQLLSATPTLADHFDVGTELVTFESIDELMERTNFYLRNPQLAAQIAAMGQRRAHRDHTYEHRLAEIIAKCTGFQWLIPPPAVHGVATAGDPESGVAARTGPVPAVD